MRKNIAQQRFGRLIAVAPTGTKKWGVYLWACVCDCGNHHIAAVNSLLAGLVQSCGCLRNEAAKKTATRHNAYGTPTYKTWDSMIQRCTNVNTLSYKNYGGRGISVCAQWRDFSVFLADMGERPQNTSLDRINPDGDYTPDNCRWASTTTQARNQRRPRLTYEQAQKIRDMYLQGAGPKFIADTLGVTRNQVGSVIYLGNVHFED
jgi:hypothetical protein